MALPAGSVDDAGRRRLAVARAAWAGDVERVAGACGDPDPRVRAAALGGLARAGATPQRVATALTAALADPAPAVRRRAAGVAAADADGGDPAVLAALVALLDDPVDEVVEVAAFACGERPDATGGVVIRLAGVAVGHDEHLCREAAVAALGSLGHPDGLAAVLAGCRDRHTVRRRAVLALAAFDGPEVTAELTRLCGDRDLQVRQAAEELLAIEQGTPAGSEQRAPAGSEQGRDATGAGGDA